MTKKQHLPNSEWRSKGRLMRISRQTKGGMGKPCKWLMRKKRKKRKV